MRDLNTPIWQLTVGEFLELQNIRKDEEKETTKSADYTDSKYVYGLAGIARLLGCSKTMVWNYRQKGWIEPAIHQNGRKIVCDAPLALELFREKENAKTTKVKR
ncbi:MAG: DUF3853 family protein [Prevotellaceae bacterium]|jgi:hypothetical protein|nr:DUF3853 family protein [Prevotellaceae bacterium]